MNELPTISSSAYGVAALNVKQPPDNPFYGKEVPEQQSPERQLLRALQDKEQQRRVQQAALGMQNAGMNIGQQAGMQLQDLQKHVAAGTPNLPKKVTMRIVKVIIADIDENLPLDRRLLYTGDEQLTDLTDQELFYEVGITELLAEHNARRAKTFDKIATNKLNRDVMLEPIRIRDLKMVVVTVASF
jgi:hypothetical protein